MCVWRQLEIPQGGSREVEEGGEDEGEGKVKLSLRRFFSLLSYFFVGQKCKVSVATGGGGYVG